MGASLYAAAGGSIIGSGTDWGFTSSDIWTTSMAVVGSLAGFLILGIAVKFTPRIFTVIKSALFSGGSK